MARLNGAWFPSVADLNQSGAFNYMACGSYLTTMADDASLKVAPGGSEDCMNFVFFSHSGRPIAVGQWGAGNESPPRSASSIATYGYTVDVGGGGYGDPAPSGTFGTDGNVSLWNAYPQGSWIVNRGGGTMYHSIQTIRGA